jgi:hypothetical protein
VLLVGPNLHATEVEAGGVDVMPSLSPRNPDLVEIVRKVAPRVGGRRRRRSPVSRILTQPRVTLRDIHAIQQELLHGALRGAGPG